MEKTEINKTKQEPGLAHSVKVPWRIGDTLELLLGVATTVFVGYNAGLAWAGCFILVLSMGYCVFEPIYGYFGHRRELAELRDEFDRAEAMRKSLFDANERNIKNQGIVLDRLLFCINMADDARLAAYQLLCRIQKRGLCTKNIFEGCKLIHKACDECFAIIKDKDARENIIMQLATSPCSAFDDAVLWEGDAIDNFRLATHREIKNALEQMAKEGQGDKVQWSSEEELADKVLFGEAKEYYNKF